MIANVYAVTLSVIPCIQERITRAVTLSVIPCIQERIKRAVTLSVIQERITRALDEYYS